MVIQAHLPEHVINRLRAYRNKFWGKFVARKELDDSDNGGVFDCNCIFGPRERDGAGDVRDIERVAGTLGFHAAIAGSGGDGRDERADLAGAHERVLSLAFRLPPHCDRASIARLSVGTSLVNVAGTRERAGGKTRMTLMLEIVEGRPLTFGWSPELPPLSRRGRGWSSLSHGSGLELRLEPLCGWLTGTFDSFSDPFVCTGWALAGQESMTLEFESGPELLLDHSPTPRGATSSKLRVCEVVHDEASVEWTVWGLAGQTYTIGWRSDRKVEFNGAKTAGNELEITFPGGPAGAFTSTKVRAVALD